LNQAFADPKPDGKLIESGTIYLASEGINGALHLKDKNIDAFRDTLRSVDKLFTDIKLNVGENFNSTIIPFKKTIIKVRKSILTDKLGLCLDWTNLGRELEAAEWHDSISSDDAVIIGFNYVIIRHCILIAGFIDCRNSYESSIGRFKNAIELNTTTFSESWKILDKLLFNMPRSKRLYTCNYISVNAKNILYTANVESNCYFFQDCTGGIRCIKVLFRLSFRYLS
jgi:UPF0176 protein